LLALTQVRTNVLVRAQSENRAHEQLSALRFAGADPSPRKCAQSAFGVKIGRLSSCPLGALAENVVFDSLAGLHFPSQKVLK